MMVWLYEKPELEFHKLAPNLVNNRSDPGKENVVAKVFISYSRKDIDFAKRLTAELQKCDLDFWIDWEGIPPTVD